MKAPSEDDQADDAEGDGDVIGGDDAGDVLENGEDGEREADEDGEQDGDLHARSSRGKLIGWRMIAGYQAKRVGCSHGNRRVKLPRAHPLRLSHLLH